MLCVIENLVQIFCVNCFETKIFLSVSQFTLENVCSLENNYFFPFLYFNLYFSFISKSKYVVIFLCNLSDVARVHVICIFMAAASVCVLMNAFERSHRRVAVRSSVFLFLVVHYSCRSGADFMLVSNSSCTCVWVSCQWGNSCQC